MDTAAISAQANAAVEDLSRQLEDLRNQQSALLQSISLTTNTLSTLPAYTSVASTFSQIPAYEAKLARLKAAMASQANTMASLRKRAEATRELRKQNVNRIKERRAREREEDRTSLRARMVGENAGVGVLTPVSVEETVVASPSPGAGTTQTDEAGSSHNGRPASAVATTSPEVTVIKTVKRKKKVRQAEMD